MTPSEVAELKRLVEKCGTDDKWIADGASVEYDHPEARGISIAVVNHEGCFPEEVGHDLASFIAAASPPIIRALIADNEAKDAEIERLRGDLERSKEFAVNAESRRLFAVKDRSAEIRDEHEPCPWPKVARRVRKKALRSYRQALTPERNRNE